DQNTMGYYGGENIVVPDRSVMSVISENGNMTAVNVLSIAESPINIKSNVISRNPKINPNFTKVVVIDIKNQNQGAFQKINGEWQLIGYVYNKTGMESQVGFETPRGYFVVPMLKYEMGYRSEIGENQGYAKYAIRFSGGGYLHGTPINFEEEINREFFMKQKEGTLGTVPGTRKCIRNVEEHSKFLFDWMLAGKSDGKSNEQRPAENVMFITF
ncbi:MAG: L,D-transpeptidase, partial [Cetobacterium sp.]